MGRQEQAETAPARARADERALYERMALIRRFEETLLELFAAGELHGTTHTCIGQEADAVGVISCLEPERDVVVSNHRCHGHYLAFTDDVDGLLREVMGTRRRRLRRQGRQPAPLREATSTRTACSAAPCRSRRGSRSPSARRAAARSRRSSSGTARSARGSSTRASTSPRSGGCRSSSSSSTTATRSRRRPACSWRATSRRARARSASRRRGTTRPTSLEVRAAAARGGRPRPLDGHALLPRPRHVPLQPALEGRRLPRPRGDRRARGCATR